MKAEDIKRIWESSYIDKEDESLKDQVIRFARACEQHGVERAKELASATCLHECRSCGGEGYDEDSESDDEDCRQCNGSGDAVDKVPINWTALDDEIEKENEDG